MSALRSVSLSDLLPEVLEGSRNLSELEAVRDRHFTIRIPRSVSVSLSVMLPEVLEGSKNRFYVFSLNTRVNHFNMEKITIAAIDRSKQFTRKKFALFS